MILHVLPTRAGGAAENMATDFMLLQRYPEPGIARFRYYGWHRPAVTFGFGQKIAWVRAQLAGLGADACIELCRRPTGGGVVDHRADWTYALVLPRGHDLADARASESYRQVHAALAAALNAQGQPAVLKARCEPAEEGGACAAGPTVCFTRPELYDVVHPETGEKIAGAAQKRSKHGLLFQGSVARSAVTAALDWDAFHEAFAAGLAGLLAAEATPTPWPDWSEEEQEALTETYSTAEWREYR